MTPGIVQRTVLLLLYVAAPIMLFLMLPIATRSSTGEVSVRPGDNIQELVAGHPAGASFSFAPGVYRLQSIQPKDGDSFTGNPGAILSGAQVLKGFKRSGQYWTAEVSIKQQGSYRGKCDHDHPACMYPEDLFIDNVPLQRVASVSDVATGKWYLDYRAGKVYLSKPPENQKVEVSLIPYAFYGSAQDVKIQGLTIEKYADVAGDGAIEGKSEGTALSQGWVIQNNLITLNHGMGIRSGNGMQILNNKIEHNGQMGLGGSGNGIVVAGNDIGYNNYAGYSYGWEAGGCKFTYTKGLVIRDNYAHNNNGPGLWTDIKNQDTVYERNRTTENKVAGILHEISYHAVIRDNTIIDDGFAAPGKASPWYGGGIVISASENVDVYGNTVTDCMNGIVGLQPDRKGRSGRGYFLRNLYVHNNVVTQEKGIAAGIVKSALMGDSVFASWDNRFAENTFHLTASDGKYFEWMNSAQTLAEWEKHGRNR